MQNGTIVNYAKLKRKKEEWKTNGKDKKNLKAVKIGSSIRLPETNTML